MMAAPAKAPTQHELIMAYLSRVSPQWVPGYDLNRVEVAPLGWLSHNASRRARELAERGAIERTTIEGVVHYRARLGEHGRPVVVDGDGTAYEQPSLL